MTLMMAICGRKKAQNLEVTGGRPAAKWNNDAFHLKRDKKIRVFNEFLIIFFVVILRLPNVNLRYVVIDFRRKPRI